MAFVPMNVTGELLTWVATMELRLVGRTRKRASLQQKFKNVQTGETEWREVQFFNQED